MRLGGVAREQVVNAPHLGHACSAGAFFAAVFASSRTYSRHALWLRISSTIGISDASAATAPGRSAAISSCRGVDDALERVVVVDPRHLEALHELLRLGVLADPAGSEVLHEGRVAPVEIELERPWFSPACGFGSFQSAN